MSVSFLFPTKGKLQRLSAGTSHVSNFVFGVILSNVSEIDPCHRIVLRNDVLYLFLSSSLVSIMVVTACGLEEMKKSISIKEIMGVFV